MTETADHRIDSHMLSRNVAWNLVGNLVPALAAVIAIPVLVGAIGTQRFGLLTLAWVVVGYFGFFDLGIGRALTRMVAARTGTCRSNEIPDLFWSSTVYMLVLGIGAGVLVAALSPWSSAGPLKIPPDLQAEAAQALLILALSIPAVIVAAGFRGFLEAYQQFKVVTAIRAPAGVLSYLAPLAVLPCSNSLPAVVLVVVAVRIGACAAFGAACYLLHPELRPVRAPSPKFRGELIEFGGWMTVSNVVGPLLLYAGRFLIAFQLSAESVAYFATPYEVVTQLLVIPGIVVGVLFPAFSRLSVSNPRLGQEIYGKALTYVGLMMLPAACIVWAFAKAGLSIWINADFASNGFRVAQLMGAGIFVNSFGLVAQSLIQAYGRPDWTAKLHVAEFMAYVPYLAWLTSEFGIEGAAMAWVLRVAISSLVLLALARRCANDARRE